MKKGYLLNLIIVVVVISLSSCESVETAVHEQIFTAIQDQDTQELYTLLKMQFDTNVVDASGKTPLVMAIETQKYEIVRALLVNEVDVNFAPKSLKGETPLSIAVKIGSPEMVQGLLVYGATPVAPDGGSLIDVAEDLGREEIVDMLNKMGVK